MEFSNEIIRSLGMTLVHSLWQGAIIAVIVLFLLGLTGKSNARFRYITLFSGLILLLAGFVTTFVILYCHNYLPTKWDSISDAALLPAEYTTNLSWPFAPTRLTGWIFQFFEPAYPALALGWLAGFLFIGIRMAGGVMVSRMNLRKGLRLPDASLQIIFDRIQDLLKLPVFVRLRMSTRMISPLVIGFLKPVVIIPAAAISGLSPEQVEAVMVHELYHIRRFDHILVILQAIAGQVLFFHPVVWFLLPEIDRERENCCDDFVVKTNNNPINYIKALTMIQEMNLHSAVPANALTGKSNQLLNRIKRLVKPELKHSPAFRLTVILLFLATIGVSAMTLIIAGKPGNLSNGTKVSAGISVKKDLQPDSTRKVIRNATVNTITDDKKDGEKKKMKIVFVNDTIKEMTVNGKRVNQAEMKEYGDEIRKIRQEMESSQKELEKTNQELEEAQIELEIARKHIEDSKEDFDKRDVFELNRQMKGALSQSHEEVKRAFEDMKIQQEEYWRSHQNEFREQMRKAQEEARKALEEMRKNKDPFFNDQPFRHRIEPCPPVPPMPEIEAPDVPDIEELMPELPEHPRELLPEEPATPDHSATESLDSKLRELEGE